METLEKGSDEYNKTKVDGMKMYFSEIILYQIEFIFYVFTNCFFMYLISKFARESKRAEQYDPLLHRHVPNIVFLQNQKLLQNWVRQKLHYDQEEKNELLRRAERTEYLHYLLR